MRKQIWMLSSSSFGVILDIVVSNFWLWFGEFLYLVRVYFCSILHFIIPDFCRSMLTFQLKAVTSIIMLSSKLLDWKKKVNYRQHLSYLKDQSKDAELKLNETTVSDPIADCLHKSWQITADQDSYLPMVPLETDSGLIKWMEITIGRWDQSQKCAQLKSMCMASRHITAIKHNQFPTEGECQRRNFSGNN